MKVNAFQINDNAVLTVKDGEELLTSGVFPVRTAGPTLREVNVEGIWVGVKITRTDDSPQKVGLEPGQTRIYWEGDMIEDAWSPFPPSAESSPTGTTETASTPESTNQQKEN